MPNDDRPPGRAPLGRAPLSRAPLGRAPLSRAFDALLQQNQAALDRLSGFDTSVSWQRHTAEQNPATTALAGLDADSIRQLHERYGDEWQFDITDHYIEDGAAVVVGILSLPKQGLSVCQSGRAPLAHNEADSAADAGDLLGSADGVNFAAGLESAIAGTDATAHWRTALANTVRNCMNWL